MALASKIVIAEVEEIVENGQIDPDHVHVPGVFVHRIVKSINNAKPIEKLTLDQKESSIPVNATREKIVRRVAQEVKSGMYVNLGIGIPTLLPNYLPKGVIIDIHSENGILGVGKYPDAGQQDPDLINAGKVTGEGNLQQQTNYHLYQETVTLQPGSSIFSSSTSFGVVRGGHLDLSILGAMEISKTGDIANWIIPGKLVKGMGGAMDLVGGDNSVIVVMEHTAKGSKKLLEKCLLPITGKTVVSKVITEKAVFELQNGELVLAEIATESSLEDVRANTGFDFKVVPNPARF